MRDSVHEFAGRRDVVVDFDGRIYCWPCLERAGATLDGVRVTGQRLGKERCADCGQVGTIVLEVDERR